MSAFWCIHPLNFYVFASFDGKLMRCRWKFREALKAPQDCAAYAPWRRTKMAENNVEAEHEWSDWALDSAEDTLIAMETLLATLRAFEDVLRQQPISMASSTEYCDNFCQVTCSCNVTATISFIISFLWVVFSPRLSLAKLTEWCWHANSSVYLLLAFFLFNKCPPCIFVFNWGCMMMIQIS